MYEQHDTPEEFGGQPSWPEGTPVYDSAGERVGTFSAQETGGDLIIRRGHIFGHDLWAPRAAVARSDATGIYLNVRRESLSAPEAAEHGHEVPALERRSDTAVAPISGISDSLGQARDSLGAAALAAQQTAGHAALAAQQAASETLAAVRNEAEGAKGVLHDKAAESMVSASDGLAGAASAVGQVSESLRRVDHGMLSQYTDRAAQQLEELAARLREMTPEQALHEVEQLAKRQPALFLAAAFAVGLLGARVLHGASGGDEKKGEQR